MSQGKKVCGLIGVKQRTSLASTSNSINKMEKTVSKRKKKKLSSGAVSQTLSEYELHKDLLEI